MLCDDGGTAALGNVIGIPRLEGRVVIWVVHSRVVVSLVDSRVNENGDLDVADATHSGVGMRVVAAGTPEEIFVDDSRDSNDGERTDIVCIGVIVRTARRCFNGVEASSRRKRAVSTRGMADGVGDVTIAENVLALDADRGCADTDRKGAAEKWFVESCNWARDTGVGDNRDRWGV